VYIFYFVTCSVAISRKLILIGAINKYKRAYVLLYIYVHTYVYSIHM